MTTSEIFDYADAIDDLIKMNEEDAAIAAYEREAEEANLNADFDEFDYESEIVRMSEWYEAQDRRPYDSFVLSFDPKMRDAVHARLDEFGFVFCRRNFATTVEVAARKRDGTPQNVAGFIGYNDDLGLTVIAAGRLSEPLVRF